MTKQQAYGIDISNYAGELTGQKAQGLAQAGVTFCIVGYQDPDLFERQVRALEGAGIKTSAYFFIYWNRIADQPARLEAMLARMKAMMQTGVSFGWFRPDGTFAPHVWLDFEEDTWGAGPGHLVPAETLRYGEAMVNRVEQMGLGVGIYTGQYWWQDHAANDTRFHGNPLWHASQFIQTVPTPFPDYFKGHEYGGWTVPMFWQYRGTGYVAGVSCDQDLEEWEQVSAPPPAEKRVIVLQNPDGTQAIFLEQ